MYVNIPYMDGMVMLGEFIKTMRSYQPHGFGSPVFRDCSLMKRFKKQHRHNLDNTLISRVPASDKVNNH